MRSEPEWASAVVREIAHRYFASRRECVDAFVDRHFSLAGTLRLHPYFGAFSFGSGPPVD
jgi:hypothetical protein